MCAEGASLPFRGADAEMKRPGDHYTFGPIVSGARPRKRRNESTPTCQHTGKGPCERMDRNPRNAKVKECERKKKEKRKKGKKHENKPTNIVPLGRLNAAEIAATTKEKASLEAAQPRQTKKRADRLIKKNKGRILTGIQSKAETTKAKAETKLPKIQVAHRRCRTSRTGSARWPT